MADTLDVFGWQADRNGCGVMRIELPLGALRAHGLRTGHSERLDEDTIPRVRTLVGQRVCMPGPTETWQALARAKQRPRLVYEIDDDLFNIEASSPVAHQFFARPDIRANIAANLAVADTVTVTTDRLAERVAEYTSAPVHVIPNYLPAALLQHTPPRRDGRLTLGWGGSPTHHADIDQVAAQVRRFMQRNTAAELHLIGTDYRPQLRTPPERTRFTPWVPSVPDYWHAIDYDVMLAPLKPSVFNASKSWLRPLEAAFLGIPTVATDYGPYAQFIRHGHTGLLARADHDWGKYLRALAEDPAMRAEMGANARQLAAHHTVEGNLDAWKKALL